MRRNPFALAAVAIALAGPTATGVARAAGFESTTSADLLATQTHKVVGLEATLAVRASRFASPGFDVFSGGDGFVERTLAASYGFARTRRFRAAAGFEWSHGEARAQARGSASSLEVDGLALALKASVPLSKRWAAFVHLAPGLVRLEATLQEGSAPPATGTQVVPPLSQTKWLPSMDVAAGAAFCVGSHTQGPTALEYRYWLTAEGGYGYAPSYAMALGGGSATAGGRSDQAVNLGNLSVRGGFMRFGLALTF